MKIFRQDYLLQNEQNVHCIEQEIEILRGLKHDHIVKIEDYGSEGLVLKPSDRKIKNLVYIMMEHVKGGILFELCEKLGGMGETVGRFFMNQLLDTIQYMHKKGVVHRDLKLENILYDDQMNLKIVDFGFATYKGIKKLESYKGTKTYMAPEIRKKQVYDGRQIDMFSTAVILFILVNGIFPFKEACTSDQYYSLILSGELDAYWTKVGGKDLSWEFKDLIIKMFNIDGSKRPTIQEIRDHPWMKKEYDHEKVRIGLIEKFTEMNVVASNANTESTAAVSAEFNGQPRRKELDANDFKSPIREQNVKRIEQPNIGELIK